MIAAINILGVLMKNLAIFVVAIFLIGTVSWLAGPMGKRSAPVDQVISHYDTDLPDAYNQFTIKADKRIFIKDMTPERVMKGLPSVLLYGDQITLSAQKWFAILPTDLNGQAQLSVVHRPGEVVTIKDNGRYTLLIYRSETDLAKPEAVTFIEKVAKPSAGQEGRPKNPPPNGAA